jgi:cytochrome c biogenesis protein CcmG, thiol:disulfide interchange protein DsbE
VTSNWDDSVEQRALGQPRSSARLIGLFLTLAIVIVVVLIVRRFTPRHDPAHQPAVGQVLANLQLEPFDEKGEKLTSADLQGAVTLINFWGWWCGPCKAEFPELMNLREKFSRQSKFRFVSVACNPNPDETGLIDKTKAFLSNQGYDLPVHRDPTLMTRHELEKLNQSEGFAYPTTVLVDQQGVIRGVWVGYHQAVVEQMRLKIDELLLEQPAEKKEDRADERS